MAERVDVDAAGVVVGTNVFECPTERSGWAERCSFWVATNQDEPIRRRQPKANRRPLILTGHGVSLSISNHALVVRGGFTHWPQPRSTMHFFPADRSLPSRIVVVDGNGSLSFDAMAWLSEQHIPLVRIDWKGSVTTVLGSAYGLDRARVEAQLEARRNGRSLPISADLIRQKIANSIDTLRSALPPSPARERAVAKLVRDLDGLAENPPATLSGLLGVEGRVAQSYFAAWQALPLHWRGIGRCPIPEEWQRIGPRQSLYGGKRGKNRRASHPINAMLNYAYAVLESQVRMAIAAEGFDPEIGYLHSSAHDGSALVFDLMEPLRPVVDRSVLGLAQANKFHPADFTIRANGVCRLNPEMAREVVRVSISSMHSEEVVSSFALMIA